MCHDLFKGSTVSRMVADWLVFWCPVSWGGRSLTEVGCYLPEMREVYWTMSEPFPGDRAQFLDLTMGAQHCYMNIRILRGWMLQCTFILLATSGAWYGDEGGCGWLAFSVPSSPLPPFAVVPSALWPAWSCTIIKRAIGAHNITALMQNKYNMTMFIPLISE